MPSIGPEALGVLQAAMRFRVAREGLLAATT